MSPRRNECDGCGVAACDLPDGVDPEFIFESTSEGVFCQACLGVTVYIDIPAEHP